jgi:hypothetical protein
MQICAKFLKPQNGVYETFSIAEGLTVPDS